MEKNRFEEAIDAILRGYDDFERGEFTQEQFIEHVFTCCIEAKTYF